MKSFLMLVLSVSIFALLASCDGADSSNDSTEEIFNTVRAYAAYDTEAYTSDVGEGEDSDDSDDDDTCDSYSYFEDEVSVTVSSIAIDNLPMDPSPLKLTSYTVRFIAHEDSPEIPNKTIRHDIEIQPGSSTTIPIRIIDQEDKHWDSSHPLNHSDYFFWACDTGGISYEYTVDVQMRMVEVLTGTAKTIDLDFPLYYFDVAEECDEMLCP